jgi:hypothetical protein
MRRGRSRERGGCSGQTERFSTRMEGAGVVGMAVNIDETRHALTVVWFSALTVREAFLRQRQLQGSG